MYQYEVPEIICGSCANAIRSVIQRVDPEGEVQVDLARKHVLVQSKETKEEIAGLIEKAGFEVASSVDISLTEG